MQVRRIAWVGVRTEAYEATVWFLRDVLGLKPAFQEPTTAELTLPNDDRVQVFGPGDRYYDFYAEHAVGPVVLFEVDDVADARAELEAAGIELVGPTDSDAPGRGCMPADRTASCTPSQAGQPSELAGSRPHNAPRGRADAEPAGTDRRCQPPGRCPVGHRPARERTPRDGPARLGSGRLTAEAGGAVMRRSPRRAARAMALAAAFVLAGSAAGTAGAAPPTSPASPDLGPNVIVFDPSMPVAEIQARVDAVNAQQVDAEMGTARYALLFKPGVYGTDATPLQMRVGYYTEVAGLGASPADVTINGKIEVYNRCLENGGTSNCLALVNFWRTLSNLTLRINAAGQDGCRASANFYAVSQAASVRRVEVTGGTLSLMDYCTAGPQWASGGYLADSRTGPVINGSQQQWLTRNSTIGTWSNGVWNQVFAGVEGAPPDATFPSPPYTTLETTPLSREKPYLFVGADGRYYVRAPSAQRNSRGVTWAGGMTAGRTLPLTDFFVARPTDSVQEINIQLARGKHLLLTPGVYDVARSIEVRRAGTVVLGLGHATLTAVGGAVPLAVADVSGVVVAGITIDAGTVNSPALLRIGEADGTDHMSDPADPTTLNDVYFRVGGPHVGKADVSLEVNSDDVLIDHIWAWRADHGVPGSVGWDVNTGRNGVIVNGDDVTATGLFVEHYQQYNVIWNGERGRTVFFQNELPYDPPNQAAWQHDGILGWAAYKVADDVRTHELWGGGAYIFTNVDPTIHASRGFEVPVTPGVRLHHVLTVNLSAGTIDHVVNDTGAPVDNSNTGTPSYVAEYP